MSASKDKICENQLDIEENGDIAHQKNELGFRYKMFNHFRDGDFCDVTLEAGKDKRK